MKAIILAGGFGTRISEETILKPKPLIEIGGKPIIWHIMKIFSQHNINDFVICCGYKGYLIKEYFANYFLHMSDVTVNLRDNSLVVHQKKAEDWKVTMIDTGEQTQTGGRIKKIRDYIDSDFLMTYGDGVGSIDITSLINFHKQHKKLATITAVQPPGRFGALSISGNNVSSFLEKPLGDGSWINGGFFVLNPKIFDLIEGDSTIWEKAPLENLASNNQLKVYFHKEFWHPVDTLRDKNHLEELWNSGKSPWKVWN